VLWDRLGHGAVFWYGAASSLLGIVALILLMPAGPRGQQPG
jgi:hypothetical protein